jgi:hypothetical protein
MHYLKTNLSLEINRLYDWRGIVWGSRYDLPIAFSKIAWHFFPAICGGPGRVTGRTYPIVFWHFFHLIQD